MAKKIGGYIKNTPKQAEFDKETEADLPIGEFMSDWVSPANLMSILYKHVKQT